MTITSDLWNVAPTVRDSGLRDPVFISGNPGHASVTVFGRGMNNAPNTCRDSDLEPAEECAVWIRPAAG